MSQETNTPNASAPAKHGAQKGPVNIKATITGYEGNSRCVTWDMDGGRYHVWVAPDGRTIQKGIVYKNPPLGVDRHSAEHFDTRKLNADSATQQRVLALVWPQVDWDAAKAEYVTTKAKEDAENEAATLLYQQQNQVKKAAADLLRLTAMLETWVLNDAGQISLHALMPDSDTETLGALVQSITGQMTLD